MQLLHFVVPSINRILGPRNHKLEIEVVPLGLLNLKTLGFIGLVD